MKTGIKNSQFKIRTILQAQSNFKNKKKLREVTVLLSGVFHQGTLDPDRPTCTSGFYRL